MVVLRLKRLGRKHRPFYRLNAMDKRAPRDGRVIEELGWFDPIAPKTSKLVSKLIVLITGSALGLNHHKQL